MSNAIATSNNALSPNAAVNAYAVQFNQFASKTAEAIIGMARVVYNAKSSLSIQNFNQFCDAIKLKKESSAIRKLTQIGKKADFLERYADRLPNTWTTVYRLTQLTNDVLEDLIAKEDVHPSLSGLEAGRLVHLRLGTTPRSKKNTATSAATAQAAANDEVYSFTIHFERIPERAKASDLEEKLNQFARETSNCSVIRSLSLDQLLSQPSNVAA